MYIYTKDNKFQCSDKPPEEFYKTDKIMEKTLRDEIAIATKNPKNIEYKKDDILIINQPSKKTYWKIIKVLNRRRKEKDNV